MTTSALLQKRHAFTHLLAPVEYPDLLALQIDSFKSLFTIGSSGKNQKKELLYQFFTQYFPITDSKENFIVEFLGYTVMPPEYTPEMCLQQGLTYDAALRLKLRITSQEEGEKNITEDDVFLVRIPCMTPSGSIIYRGTENVVIAQLKRSYGVFFSETKHLSGGKLYFAKIIPEVGGWIEFSVDTHNTMYVYLDRHKKVPVTTFLRTMGYGSDQDILQLFNIGEEVAITRKKLEQHKGHILAGQILRNWSEEFVDEETGEVITVERQEVVLERNTPITDEVITVLLNSGEKRIMVLNEDIQDHDFAFIYETLNKDSASSEREALNHIYFHMFNTEPVDEHTAKEAVKQLVFHPKRRLLGKVGRFCLNKKLNLNVEEGNYLLTHEDILATIRTFPDLMKGRRSPEDLDSLSNRLVQLSGDLFSQALLRGVKFTANYIRESLNDYSSLEPPTPLKVTSGHHFISAINAFFGLDVHSQYMDQVNPLSGVEQARRLTKLGNSLTSERAGFDARNIHPTFIGRLCPVTTPEGLKSGLVVQFAVRASVDEKGFLQAPYKRVQNGRVILEQDHYLTAEDENKQLIAQFTHAIDKKGNITAEKIHVRDNKGDFRHVGPQEVNYMDQRSDHAFSISTSLIPFLENTDSIRATMGANMQRQAIPLENVESPIVGTGHEKRVAEDSRVLLTAEDDGTVVFVDATKVVIEYHIPPKFKKVALRNTTKTHYFARLRGTNQGTCCTQKPIVKVGDKVKKGQFLCEGYSIHNGELALGRNVVVAILPWNGFTFEDSMVISERLQKDDVFTSIHLEEFTVDLYKTKLGPEEFTADIPNVTDEEIRHLDDNGIVREGTKIKDGDILVGKITPQSDENPTSESKLIAAIFGELAGNVKNTSKRAPFACEGTVISTRILESASKMNNAEMRAQLKELKIKTTQNLESLRKKAIQKTLTLLQKDTLKKFTDREKNKIALPDQQLTVDWLKTWCFPQNELSESVKNPFLNVNFEEQWTTNKAINEKLRFLLTDYEACYIEIINSYKRQQRKIQVGDDLPPGVLKQAKVLIARKSKPKAGDKFSGRHGNKSVVSKVVPEEDMPFLPDGTPVDIVINPLSVPSRMNFGQMKEAVLGWAGRVLGKKYITPVFEGPDMTAINEELAKAELPSYGRTLLFDGLTGEPFEQKVTCGVIYMLKLNHLVQNKIHARSTGPYALMTQQPLGGRSREGGQRFGEMEGWAGAAHGAAHFLNENLTLKSDDVEGRQRVQEAIYKGTNMPSSSVPESLRLLEQTLASAGVSLTFE